MEPNEMRRFTFSLNHGYEDDERGDLVFYEDAMQIITALQEKIDGMIKRPVVEAIYNFMCNELAEPNDTGALIQACTMLEEALGMDDAKEGGEG